jgi:predicted ATPase
MADLPTGTVTFLFTDIEGSTRLLSELGPDGYAEALASHRRVIRDACAASGGVEVDTQGDAFLVAFPSAAGALAAAGAISEGLASGPIKVRIGIHTGSPTLTDDGYVGADVHLGARIAAAGHGGQVLVSGETRALLDDGELIDLGEHRLKDFASAVEIFQLGSERFPPLRTISNTNLPRPANSFVGRETEVDEVAALLSDGARLLTLTGPGGSGKTRLAIEAASTLVPAFRAGVFWVGLAPLRDPALVVETIGQTLGAKDGLADHIGEREMLLLVDNLEQVIEAAPELAALVETCPKLRLLVTSRERLRVRGEREYPVSPLADTDAVTLFCERANTQPDATIHALCRALDDLPLAIELAAARASVLTPAQISERLSGRLDLLRGGRDADPRQATLRATIEWSYELLTPDEQRLFARLSVFRGGCTLEAAERVTGADLDTLASLVDKSLLRHLDERFVMLETIREYASERLTASGEADDLRRRHADSFLALAEEAEPHILWSPPGWEERLEAELDNLRGTLDWLEKSGSGELALRLAGAAGDFWINHVGEGRHRLDAALAMDQRPTPARARALHAAVQLSHDSRNTGAALAWAEEALEIYRDLGDAVGVATANWALGLVFIDVGDHEHAVGALEEAIRFFRQVGDGTSAVGATHTLALAYRNHGDHGHARALHEANLGEARALGLKDWEASSLGALAMIAFEQGRWDDAESLGVQNLRAALDVGSLWIIAESLCRHAQNLVLLRRMANAAAQLLGWFEAQQEHLGVNARVTSMNERTLAAIMEQLDAEALAAAWEAGGRLTVTEAASLALDALDRQSARSTSVG